MTGTSVESTSNNAASASSETAAGAEFLSSEETREILTPFAFKIDKSLYGTALATPQRRLIALLIDLTFVAILSDAPGELLAIFIAVILFRVGSKKRASQLGKVRGAKRRAFVRFIGAFIVFVVLLQFLPKAIDSAEELVDSDSSSKVSYVDSGEDNAQTASHEMKVEQAIIFAAISAKALTTISDASCNQLSDSAHDADVSIDCWYQELQPIVNQLPEVSLPEAQVREGITIMVEATKLPQSQQTELSARLSKDFERSMQEAKQVEKASSEMLDTDSEAKRAEGDEFEQAFKQYGPEFDEMGNVAKQAKLDGSNTAVMPAISEQTDKPIYSFMELVKGIIDDLGLGFGWAAFYFTVLTALWQGQTLGKKMLGIKVLQLDGTPLSIWDSFGRYGGYGAGIATGLLGFLQIFWNPNRQAIHDQISSTVVVYANASDFRRRTAH